MSTEELSEHILVKVVCILFIISLSSMLLSTIIWKIWLPESNLWEKITETIAFIFCASFISLIIVADSDEKEIDEEKV